MADNPLIRVTLFKLINKDDAAGLVEQYAKMKATAKKDGKPYILSAAVGPCYEDPRNPHFNFVAQTTYASKEDMDYYDHDCEAHKALKAWLGPRREGDGPPTVIYYHDALTSSSEFLKLQG